MEPGEHTELSVDGWEALRDWIAFRTERMRENRAEVRARIDEQRRLFGSTVTAASQTERARLLYEAENKANEFVMAGDALVEAVLYKLLYARGLRIASIENEIRKALDQRLGIR